MGGDHKCPVCQATFTRPQHVARHMRSHTGDRPYKCQYCGDQFARSDLLSRHINKCHANEKPMPSQGSRRKGSTSASRATTSKQACDQCVQSSLPCDGSNPCAKCVQRKCRCTYVKFHRQTAPVGPGHNPRPAVPPNAIPGPASAARIPISSYPPDEFFLGPAPTSANVPSMAESLYPNPGFSFPPLYPDPASATAPVADFTSKYRAQAELLRNGSSSAHFAPAGGTSTVGPGMPPGGGNASLESPHMYSSDQRPASGGSWGSVSWGHDSPDPYHGHPQQGTLHDKDMQQQGHHRSHHPSQQGQYVNTHGVLSSSGAGSYHQGSSAAYLRRGSVDFSSDGSVSAAEHSSAASNNILDPGLATTHPLSYNPLENLSDHRGDYAGAATSTAPSINRGLQGSSAAFDLMSVDDNPNRFPGDSAPSFFPPPGMNLSASNMNMPLTGLSSISGIPADDPDATPMPLKEASSSTTFGPVTTRSASAGGGVPVSSGSTSRDGSDLRELREFWKQYMRTPLSVPEGTGGQPLSPPRRPRVASMPSSKTPTIALSLQQQQQGEGRGGESGVRTTLNEDLRSYEAAVMARKAPTNLNLVPKRRGTIPALAPPYHHGHHGHQQQHSSSVSPVDTGYHHQLPNPIAGKGIVPLVKYDLLCGGLGTAAPSAIVGAGGGGSRPSSSSTNRSGGSSGGDGSSSSLAGAFGNTHHHHNQSPYPPTQAPPTQQLHAFTLRRGSPSASSTSTTGGSSSRASSVSTDHAGEDGDVEIGDENDSAPEDDDYHHHHHRQHNNRDGRKVVDSVGRLRPSFKRLASSSLGPGVSKRQFLVPPGGGGGGGEGSGLSTREVEGGMESVVIGGGNGGGGGGGGGGGMPPAMNADGFMLGMH